MMDVPLLHITAHYATGKKLLDKDEGLLDLLQ